MKKLKFCFFVVFGVISYSNLYSNNINAHNYNLSSTPPDTIMHPPDSLMGDFNGDGKKDTILVNCSECFDEEKPEYCFCVLSFSNKLPSIKITNTMGSVSLYNLGDLNNDGSDEIGYIQNWHSMWKEYYVLTLRKGVWVDLVKPFTVNLNNIDEGLVPIEKDKKKKGHVIVRSSLMVDPAEPKIETKSIKVY